MKHSWLWLQFRHYLLGLRFNFVCSTAFLHQITMRYNKVRTNISGVLNLDLYMYHISQGDDVRHSMTTNITVASPTFTHLVLGVANDCEMPHFTSITLASWLFSPETLVAIFVGRSKSIPCKIPNYVKLRIQNTCTSALCNFLHSPVISYVLAPISS